MEIRLLNYKKKELNKIHKNCLKGTESLDYIDLDESEKIFYIYENDIKIGEIEACLAPEKAGLQIVRMRTNNVDLLKKEEIISNFANFVFDYKNIDHIVLAIHINIVGSGIDFSIAEHLGFVGKSGLGSKLYTILNQEYIHLVESLAVDLETMEELSKYYYLYHRRKEAQLEQVKNFLLTSKMVLEDEETRESDRLEVKKSFDYYTGSINNLTSHRK